MEWVRHYSNRDFYTDTACLEMVFSTRYGKHFACPKCHKIDRFSLITGRKRYDCQCGYGIYPLAGTIFQGSATPLRLWFYAIYLFAASRDGIASKELERQLGVTYKTAWRIGRQIRLLFMQQDTLLTGTIEADDASAGTADSLHKRRRHITDHKARRASTKIASHSYRREIVRRKIQAYANNHIRTNNVESFWPQLNRSLEDTHHIVSPKYLQSYVDEVVFRYNNRRSPGRLFALMLHEAVKQTPSQSVKV